MPGEDLSKRRCSISAAKSPSPQEDQAVVPGSRLSPYTVHSPGGSPSKHHRAKVYTVLVYCCYLFTYISSYYNWYCSGCNKP